MSKVTYDMLDGCSDVVKATFRLLYPNGLTMEQLEQKAKEYNWLRMVYVRIKEKLR